MKLNAMQLISVKETIHELPLSQYMRHRMQSVRICGGREFEGLAMNYGRTRIWDKLGLHIQVNYSPVLTNLMLEDSGGKVFFYYHK